MSPVIEVVGLRKVYGETVGVHGVSFEVAEGEVFGILGPNGAGKTTTVECIAGLRRPDGGTVRVLGLDPARDPAEVRARVGVQLQEAALPDRMRVSEAMAVFASAYDNAGAVPGLLEQWGLWKHRRAAYRNLSGGQRQRLFVALAMLGAPEVVVLDELATGLDPAARRDTWELVRRMRDEGVTVVLVTHAMDEAEALCDRIAIIAAGRVLESGTPRAVAAGHANLDEAYLAITDAASQEV